MVYTIESQTNNSIHNDNANQDHKSKNTTLNGYVMNNKFNGFIGCVGCVGCVGCIGCVGFIGCIGGISIPFTGYFKLSSNLCKKYKFRHYRNYILVIGPVLYTVGQ